MLFSLILPEINLGEQSALCRAFCVRTTIKGSIAPATATGQRSMYEVEQLDGMASLVQP
jgi:hypothetical protein